MNNYQQCNRCVMDTTAENIFFNEDGICNYCIDFEKQLNSENYLVKDINKLINQIKQDGQNKEYDCIVGFSGGADSSYSLHLAKEHGLRVLAVHMDNGWNSELATNNIKNLIEKLDIDLYTHVIDWEEYRKLMQAFFDADVIDIELLYDNAMLAINYKLASKYNIKYILSGSNSSTEGISMPSNWNWHKLDKKNIFSLAKRNKIKINTFPSIGRIELAYFRKVRKIQWIPFLDYIDYNKKECMKFLEEEYAFKPYPYKHYESIFTRFYQGYILPMKFNVDKRRLHLSAMIMTNQISRQEVLEILKEIPYESLEYLKQYIEYFLK